MRKHLPVLLYVLCVVLPTLVGGFFALRMLGGEAARMRAEARAALEDRARLAADNVAAAVLDVQSGLILNLRQIDASQRADQLRRLASANPLVRNVFIWNERGGLNLPDARSVITDEERSFVERYAALWSGRQSWPIPVQREEGETGGRYELRKVASRSAVRAPDSGWLPWFSGGELYLLGWVSTPDGLRYGVELEQAALQARLQNILPAPHGDETALALSDGEGRVVVQRGTFDTSGGARPDFVLPVGTALPHWQVAVYAKNGTASTGVGFRLLATLMVCGLAVAVLVGGVLLLREVRRQARDAAQKTSFVSNVSHELRTPLTTIRMYGELLAENRVPDEAKRRSYLETIVRESQRLTRLVNNVLDFSRIEMNRKKYRVEDIPVTPWLHEVLDSQRTRAEEAGVRLEVDSRFDGSVRADRDAIDQILLNLLDNALKYAAAGGVVRFQAECAGEIVRIRVLDHGPGIPPRLSEKIFEKFYRVDDSLTARVAGSGLGLSIARRQARDLGGDLVHAARAGGGACFELRLPIGGHAS